MSSFTLLYRYEPLSCHQAAGIGRRRHSKTFRSACLCVSLEKPSADAGSLGHLASAKEKGKLLHRGGGGRRGVENRNFKEKYILLFGKCKEIPRWLFALLSGANARILGSWGSRCWRFRERMRVFFFVSEDFGWSECATGEEIFLLRLTSVEDETRRLRCGRADVGPGCSC